MDLLKAFTRPVRDLTDAVVMPFKALFVVGLCALINYMTFRGHWWVQWVALGMGIAVLVAWARGLRTLLLLGAGAWAMRWWQRRQAQAGGKPL